MRLLLICGLALALAPAALATSTPTVSVTPNPVVFDPAPDSAFPGFITVSGCGYAPFQSLSAIIQASITLSATTNATGCFTVYYNATFYGLNTVVVYPVKQGARKALATTTFLVVPPA